MKASWMTALALSASMMGSAWADLSAHVYDGWGFDCSGNISTAGLTPLGSFIDPQIDHWDGSSTYKWILLGEVSPTP